MNIINVFIKNLKVVFRSPVFFVFLFVLPLVLVLSMAALFNSADYRKLSMGIVDKEDLGITNMRTFYFKTIEECKHELSLETITFCIEKNKLSENNYYTVYYDNHKGLISSTVRENLFEIFLEKQNTEIEVNSNQVKSKIFSTEQTIDDAYSRLESSKSELSNQKTRLIDYRNKLLIFENTFDRFYEVSLAYENNAKQFSYDIKVLKNDLEIIKQSINDLPYGARVSFTALENFFNKYSEGSPLVESSFPQELKSFKIELTRVREDLDDAISDIDSAMFEINSFQKLLNLAKQDLSIFQNSKEGLNEISFVDAFPNGSEQRLFSYFPMIATLIITFTSVILSNLFILRSYSSKSRYREFISPVSDITFVLGDFLICFLFVIFETSILFLIGNFLGFYHFNLASSYFLVVVLLSPIFILIGIVFGYLIKSNILSMLVSVFFVIFSFVFSDVFIPFSFLKEPLHVLVSLNPFYLYKGGFEKIILYDQFLPKSTIVLVFVYISFLLIFSIISKKINRRRFFE